MAERQAQIFKLSEEGAEVESVDVKRLPFLISGAAASHGSDRIAVATQINRVLIAMRAPGHEEAESQLVIAALDAHRFDGLVDEQGRACRKEAVETLLACGFPHALNIAHEDLTFARGWKPPAVEDPMQVGGWALELRKARRASVGVILSAQALMAVVALRGSSETAGGLALTLAIGMLALITSLLFANSKSAPADQSAFGTALAMFAVVQAVCAMAIGPTALIGAAGIVLGIFTAFGSQYSSLRDPPKPGDWDYTENKFD